MVKRSKGPKRASKNRERLTHGNPFTEEDMDDEIDAFHKQRDVVSLNVDNDFGSESDEDMEQPVFDIENDDDQDIDSEDDEDDANDEDTGFAAKIARQEKFLRHKLGVVDEEVNDDAEGEQEEEEEERSIWGRSKSVFYGADNVDSELRSSDDEDLALEEAEALKIQKEKAKFLKMADFGLEDVEEDGTDSEGQQKILQDLLAVGRTSEKHSADDMVDHGSSVEYKEVKQDYTALTKEERMDILLSSAPEVVGLLSELKDALNQLENKVNPFISKVKEDKTISREGVHYVELKQLLLLAYCQSISLYLLLKSEGHAVRDHPILARLVEINHMMKKMKQIDGSLPFQIDEILNLEGYGPKLGPIERKADGPNFESCAINQQCFIGSAKMHQGPQVPKSAKTVTAVSLDGSDCQNMEKKLQKNELGVKSMEMMKVREKIEENLKRKGVYVSQGLKAAKIQKISPQLANRRLERLNDFDDEVMDKEAAHQGVSNRGPHLSKLPQLVATKTKTPKVVSGDDDLPARDEIGERRRKYELQVLAKAGFQHMDMGEREDEPMEDNGTEFNDEDGHGDSDSQQSEDEFYKEAKRQYATKLAVKAELYGRNPQVPLLQEEEVDGKRQITYQMEKNKGLTRTRKKQTKIPRKKYKLKHKKAMVRRKGQVRELRRPTGSYGGEATGINTQISRSIRFKS